jgi:DNA-binding CsgD family transcriptional regulator
MGDLENRSDIDFAKTILSIGAGRGPRAMPVSGRRNTRAKSHTLTAREVEVLTWVAKGKSAWEIGEILDIAKRTVDEHAQTAVRKIGAVNRTHAVAIAVRDSIISI